MCKGKKDKWVSVTSEENS